MFIRKLVNVLLVLERSSMCEKNSKCDRNSMCDHVYIIFDNSNVFCFRENSMYLLSASS